MSSSREIFVCSDCGNETTKWLGQCPSCGAWNTLREVTVRTKKTKRGVVPSGAQETRLQKLSEVVSGEEVRLTTGIAEVDRCLGGGFMQDEVVLIAGEPGIGKSTLLLQIAAALSNALATHISVGCCPTILYASGEESPAQIKSRAERLGIGSAEHLAVLSENNLELLLAKVVEANPQVLIVDSIQTLATDLVDSVAGSPAQIRECAAQLTNQAKRQGLVLILVGHVTKEGVIAGPKLLEHIVDAVLYLEGDNIHSFRLLRVHKNRFGATDEVGVFAMTKQGLMGVDNPSALFLEGRLANSPGSVVCPVVQGNRCFLVEVQALTTHTTFSLPRRTVSGVSFNRVLLILAVLQKKAGVDLSNLDVFVSVAGGLKVEDVGVDLAIAVALYSSFKQQLIKAQTAVYGELGLAGEVRNVTRSDLRDKEAQKLGYQTLITPQIKTLNAAIKAL